MEARFDPCYPAIEELKLDVQTVAGIVHISRHMERSVSYDIAKEMMAHQFTVRMAEWQHGWTEVAYPKNFWHAILATLKLPHKQKYRRFLIVDTYPSLEVPNHQAVRMYRMVAPD